MQIARSAELSITEGQLQNYSSVSSTADMALRLIDSYILSIMPVQDQLPLEPISVSVVLQEAAHRLQIIADEYNCQIEVKVCGKYGPVMANRENIDAAYTMLGYALLQAQKIEDKPKKILLVARKNSTGLAVGVFGSQDKFSSENIRNARDLYGVAKQPLSSVMASGGAGIFIADTLLQAMHAPLHNAKFQKLNGLAATLLPSYQLRFENL